MISVRQHFWILIILLTLLVCPFFLNAQDTINLKSPVVTYLTDVPAPKKTLSGVPKTNIFPPNIVQGKGFFTTYDTDDGLAMDVINYGYKSVLCDSGGNLWLGTPGNGVSKYDGKSFTTYNTQQGLVSNVVTSIIEDRKGNIWFGTEGGVSKYNGEKFTTYNTEHGLANNYILSITEDKVGNIWFGTRGFGVSKYDGESFRTYSTKNGLANNRVFSIIEDRIGNIWFGTEGGVSKYDGNSFTTYSTEQGLTNNNVRNILEDKIGNIWFATFGGGVSKYDGKSFATFSTEHGLVNNRVRSITEDKEGNIWFGTDEGGVSKFNGKLFTTYTKEQGLANNKVCSITEDKTGNIWFGTYGGGISKYSGESFRSYNTEQGLGNNLVLCISEDAKGYVWFGTYGGGISKYNGKAFTTYTTQQGLESNIIYTIFEDKIGNIWFSSPNGGVSKFNGEHFITYTKEQGLANNIVLNILEDKAGNLWFGTYGSGVSKFDGVSFTNYTTEQGLANNIVRSIIEDNAGNIWFGTFGGGVSKFDRNRIIPCHSNACEHKLRDQQDLKKHNNNLAKSFTNYTTEQGLANNIVLSIFEDQTGDIWFGTYGGGVSVLRQEFIENNDNIKFLTIDISNGLPDNYVTGIIEDKIGNIIIGTNFGLGIIPLGDFDKGIEIYNQFTGYPVRDVNGGSNNGALFCDSKGIIWAGTGSDKTALVRFDYNAIHKDSELPKVVIQKVSVKGEDVCWYSLAERQKSAVDSIVLVQQEAMTYGKRLSLTERGDLKKRFSGIEFDGIKKFYPLPENLVLPYKYNHVAFDFLTIETDRSFLVNYQYMLVGQDEVWSPITKKTDVTFNNLHEGVYTFLLKAQSPWGVWSTPVQYSFTVLPPWYRSWWAYVFYFMILMGGISAIVQFQTKKLVVRQKRLQVEVNKATVEIRKQNVVLERQKEKLSKKNEEKTAMLKEIHHRVKNNLQIVNSLLRLQSREFEDEHAIAMFKEAQDRVLSMALLHEKMYRSDNLKYIDVQEHISLLVEDLIKSYAVGKIINLDIQIEELDIGIQTLVPLGLIINELITNAFKYAFVKKRKGTITIHIKNLKNYTYEMIIGDDGIGLTEEKKSTGIGTKLIQIFTKQLNGTLVRLEQPGAVFQLVFEKID